jgi:putative transposase
MPRIARIVAEGYPHHVTQRGNYQQTVFETDEDYTRYLDWLRQYSDRYALKIWAYCLMSNHVHFIAVPAEGNSLSRTFNTLHMRYSQHINKRRGTNGHLWQGRFYSCVLDESHLYAAVRYVENNPVRAGLVKQPHEYMWSSTRAHVLKKKDAVLSDDCHIVHEIGDWLEYLRAGDEAPTVSRVRECTRTGRPCGDEAFSKKIEGILGKRLRTSIKGRPRKKR